MAATPLAAALAPFAAAGLAAAQGPLLELHGEHYGDRYGQSVASSADFDGDGLADVVVGAPRNGSGASEAGAVFVHAGSDGSVLLDVRGDGEGDHLGRSVASVGDVDGDGVPDLAVGVPFADGVGTDAGAVRVLSGKDGSLLFLLDGPGPSAYFGWSVAGAGDVDGDGVPDVVAGAYGDDAAGEDAGRVRVHSGASGAVLLDVSGDAAGDFFGHSVSGAGDVDGDGLADVLVGAPQGTSPFGIPTEEGYARVLSGADGGTIQHHVPRAVRFGFAVAGGADFDLDGVPDAVVGAAGGSPGSTWILSGADGSTIHQVTKRGYSVAAGGDVNGDGFPDVVIGQNQGAGDMFCPKSIVHVVSGRDATVLFAYEAKYGGDAFGESVAVMGDVNGDGFADPIAGATKKIDTFPAYCVAGAGYVLVHAGAHVAPLPPLDPLLHLVGEAPGSFGRAVAGAGDVDADGVPDLLVGARYDFTVAPGAGRARVHSGADGAVLLDVFGGGEKDYLGVSVAAVGDVDGDGHADVLIGAHQEYSGNPGYARLVSGRTGVVLFEPTGDASIDRFGAAVAGVGDADADGVPDFLVGIPGRLASSGPGFGGARLFSGADGTVVLDVWDSSPTGFGWAVAGVGDLDADGEADLLLGAPSDQFTTKGGSVRALRAKGDVLHVWYGGGPAHGFGDSIAGVGDLDHDGFPDVVVGATQGFGTFGPGYARVLSGGPGGPLFEVHGSDELGSFGYAVAGLGDTDGDLVPDFAVGDFLEVVRVFSGADGSLLRPFASTPLVSPTFFGRAVAGAGDLNGDGLGELLVGVPLSVSGVGSAYVFSVLPAPFGEGCATSLGLPPVAAFAGGVPTVGGGGYEVFLLGAPPSTPAKLLAGPSSSTWGGFDLPLDLAFAGAPGCALLVAPLLVVPVPTDELGEARVAFDVPAVPSLAGLELDFQWAVLELPAGAIALSGALHAIVAPEPSSG